MFARFIYFHLSILTLLLSGCQMAGAEENVNEQPQFCPFGVCMGVDSKSLYQNNQNGVKSSVDVPVAFMIFPPNPVKLLGDNYPPRGSNYKYGLDGISYEMYFTESLGVCMIGLSAGFENSMLVEFYKNLTMYLSIEMPPMPMGSEEKHQGTFDWYRLRGDDISHLDGIEEIFISTGGFVDDDRKMSSVYIWFNNSSECIKQYPILNWRNERYGLERIN